jgi:hypothetical protein
VNAIERAARAGNLAGATREALIESLNLLALIDAVFAGHLDGDCPGTQEALDVTMLDVSTRLEELQDAVQRAGLVYVGSNGRAVPGCVLEPQRPGEVWVDAVTAEAFRESCEGCPASESALAGAPA